MSVCEVLFSSSMGPCMSPKLGLKHAFVLFVVLLYAIPHHGNVTDLSLDMVCIAYVHGHMGGLFPLLQLQLQLCVLLASLLLVC